MVENSQWGSRLAKALAFVLCSAVVGCPIMERSLNEPPVNEDPLENALSVDRTVRISTKTHGDIDPDGYLVWAARDQYTLETRISEKYRIGPNGTLEIVVNAAPTAWYVGDVASGCKITWHSNWNPGNGSYTWPAAFPVEPGTYVLREFNPSQPTEDECFSPPGDSSVIELEILFACGVRD